METLGSASIEGITLVRALEALLEELCILVKIRRRNWIRYFITQIHGPFILLLIKPGVSQNNQKKEESNLWQFDEIKEPHQKLGAALNKAGWYKNKSTVHKLDIFTRFVGRVTKTSEINTFLSILRFSWTVTSIADLNKVLEEKQVRHLRKLSDYVRIIKHMPLLLKKVDKAKITIEQVIT